jgi:hypothetical protein
MALFGSSRDISLFRNISRELMADIISQEVVFYKCNITDTKVNMYGEASSGRVFEEPILLNSLVERNDQTSPIQDEEVGFAWPIIFRFLRDDLVDANLVPEVGDFVMWNEGYWEIDNTNANQYFVGKNPDYPYYDSNGNNPLNPGLEEFGYNVSIICTAHYVPADRLNIIKQRL